MKYASSATATKNVLVNKELLALFAPPFLRNACRMLAAWAIAHLLVPSPRIVREGRTAGHR